MEELNKTQLVLLMLFISFVTSIATGIVTVTLLEQAPKSVTQQINRVVERTVEKVVPGPGITKTINTTSQVVVSEDDLIIKAVQKTSPALVRIRVPGTLVDSLATTTTANMASIAQIDAPAPIYGPDTFVTGLMVSDAGRVITAPVGLFTADSVGKEYKVAVPGFADEMKAKVVYESDTDNLVVLDIETDKSDHKFEFIAFPTGTLALGQTLVLLDFTNGVSPTVNVGRITGYIPGNASSTQQVITNIDTTSRIIGDPLIDTNGSFADFLKKGGSVTPYDGIKMALNKGFDKPVDKETKGQ